MTYYNNNQGGHHQQGGYGQQGGGGGYQQGGYQQDRPGPGGEASSYYSQPGQQQGGFGGQQGGFGGQQGGFGGPQGGFGGPQGGPQGGFGQQHHNQGGNFSSPPPYQNQGYGGPGGPGGPEGEDGERGLAGALAGGAAGAFGGNKIGGNYGHSKSSTVLGALAGAFAGHKLQDGVSDWKHKRDDEKKEEEHRHDHDHKHDHRPDDHHHNQPPPHHDSHRDERPRGGNYAGGFTGSARDIRLDAHGDYNLRASCKRRDGGWQESCISLNRVLENDNGSFRWSSGGGGGGGQTNYTVQQGDTLRNIAARFNTNFEEIARRNNISNPDQIWPGQNLQVPQGGGGGGCGGNFGASARDVRLVDGGQRLEAELMRNGQWVHSSIVLDERISNNDGTLHLI